MELAMIGLGRMGGNMTARLLKGGHRVAAYDLNTTAAVSYTHLTLPTILRV